MSADTPQTNRALCVLISTDGHPMAGKEFVPAEFARILERENIELRGKLERLATQFEKRPDGYIPARELRAILNEEASK